MGITPASTKGFFMYENWIKFEKLTLEKPEVYQLASLLKIDVHSVVGKLLIIWSWFDDHTEDGTAPISVIPLLDGKTCKGFCAAMQDKSVGWLSVENGTVSICNYDKHNGQSAKKRAKETSKKRGQRRDKNSDFYQSCPQSVPIVVGTNSGHKNQSCPQSVPFLSLLARFSQFYISFFLFQGTEFIKYSVLEGGFGTEVQNGA